MDSEVKKSMQRLNVAIEKMKTLLDDTNKKSQEATEKFNLKPINTNTFDDVIQVLKSRELDDLMSDSIDDYLGSSDQHIVDFDSGMFTIKNDNEIHLDNVEFSTKGLTSFKEHLMDSLLSHISSEMKDMAKKRSEAKMHEHDWYKIETLDRSNDTIKRVVFTKDLESAIESIGSDYTHKKLGMISAGNCDRKAYKKISYPDGTIAWKRVWIFVEMQGNRSYQFEFKTLEEYNKHYLKF